MQKRLFGNKVLLPDSHYYCNNPAVKNLNVNRADPINNYMAEVTESCSKVTDFGLSTSTIILSDPSFEAHI
jgi:hypothetical protein